MAITLRNFVLTGANPAPFKDDMVFNLTMDVTRDLPDPIDVVFTWVADLNDNTRDVVLEELEVGPFDQGANSFDLDVEAPRFRKLVEDKIIGSTCITVTFLYHNRRFLHVGFPVSVTWMNDEHEMSPPEVMVEGLVKRELLLGSKRLVSAAIAWTKEDEEQERAAEGRALDAARDAVVSEDDLDDVSPGKRQREE